MGPLPEARAGSLEPFPYSGIPCPALMQGGGAWLCLNLIGSALLTPMGGLYLLNEKGGGVDGKGRREVGGGNKRRRGRRN